MATILLVPGLLCDETVWQPALRELPDAQVADLSTQDDIRQMAKDCLAQYPGEIYLAGHSMGARVAMEMARIAPGRVTRLALLDTGIHPLKDGETESRKAIIQFAYDNGMQALANRWLPGMVYEPNRDDAQLMKALNDMVLSKTPELHERQITALVRRPNASAYLAEITCPTLLVVGRQDQWSPVSQHQDMLALLPNARLEIIENAGHFAPLEQPESVANALAEFFS